METEEAKQYQPYQIKVSDSNIKIVNRFIY